MIYFQGQDTWLIRIGMSVDGKKEEWLGSGGLVLFRNSDQSATIERIFVFDSVAH